MLTQGGFLALMDLFSGGGYTNFSIFALSVFPYINASIIIQLLSYVIPSLEELVKEGGDEGKRKIARYTRYLTVALGILQAFSVIVIFRNYLVNQVFFLRLLLWQVCLLVPT